ncbi:MAG: hypothetical protein EPN33_10310 [Acidobacteria bacterium]|nr:MAG: hypothetical protein EPN33_10310 [Acidobacteriota bacterium]
MRFLADESCPAPLIFALRAAGQDVTAVSEFSPGASDEQVLAHAADEKRVLLTEDRDFGEIVFSRRQPNEGVVLIRFPAGARSRLSAVFLEAVVRLGEQLRGAFTVIEPGRVRSGRRP